MKNGGAFIVAREIFGNCIWQNIVEFRLFMLICGNAVFREEGIKMGDVHVKKGQWLRSYRYIQNDLEYIENRAIKRYSLSRIKRAVDKLVNDKRIKIEPCELGTLFTVCNYRYYQDLCNYGSNNENAERTQRERRENNKKKDIKDKNEESNKINVHFETIWKHYPEKKGKGKISLTRKKELYKVPADEMIRAIERYKQYVAQKRSDGFSSLMYQNGSTFFNGSYIDYLDENYRQTLDTSPPPGMRFSEDVE